MYCFTLLDSKYLAASYIASIHMTFFINSDKWKLLGDNIPKISELWPIFDSLE